MTTFELGSQTAKGGFANEKSICKKFNNWKGDNEARQWLKIMGHDINQIDSAEAIHIPTRLKMTDTQRFDLREDFEELMRFKKADAQLRIKIVIGNIIKIENLSLKKANSDADYNQIDKRWVDSYREIWGFDDEIALCLKLFTGEVKPSAYPKMIASRKLRDKRRVFLDELREDLKDKVITFFKENKILVVTDIIKGRGGLSANWMLVTRYNKKDDTTTWILKDINRVMNFFGHGEVRISPKGSLYIGRITMQRKGGDAGRPTANMLQFKIKPCNLFNLI